MEFPPPGGEGREPGGSSIRQKGKGKMNGDGKKAKKPCRESSKEKVELTENEKALLTLVNELKPEKEELAHVVKLYGDKTYRSTKKAENEGYKKLADETNAQVQIIMSTMGELSASNKQISNNQTHMTQVLSMITTQMSGNTQEGTENFGKVPDEGGNHSRGHQQGHGNGFVDATTATASASMSTEHGRDKSPKNDAHWSDFVNFSDNQSPDLQQMLDPATPPMLYDFAPEATTSAAIDSTEENVRLQKQVDELKNDIQILNDQVSELIKRSTTKL